MKAGYLKAPNQFEVRDVNLPEIKSNQALIKIEACGFCGHDKIMAGYAASDWEPFGHEFSGVVEQIGKDVEHLKIGDSVVIETSTFNPLSREAQGGHPEFDTNGPSYMNIKHVAMGFSEYTIVPAELCVPFEGITFEQASFVEPMGVAYDMVLNSDIRLGQDVVIMGCGAIGLMVLQMVKASGARNIYVVDRSYNKKKTDLALEYGATEVLFSDKIDITKFEFPNKGVDRVLVTTPPSTIDVATRLCNVGGIVSFLGITYGEGAVVSFDSNIVHLNKIQIRGANAIPAMYFPQCLELLYSGMVDVKKLISHRLTLDNLESGLIDFLNDKQNGVKAVMVRKG